MATDNLASKYVDYFIELHFTFRKCRQFMGISEDMQYAVRKGQYYIKLDFTLYPENSYQSLYDARR